MKRPGALLLALGVLVLGSAAARADSQAYHAIAHGRYLTTLGDCMPCHTQEGGSPFAGGRAVETPFGVVVSPNITPDRDTGIGGWTDDEFVAAIRHGIGRAGEHLYPAMPYVYYTKASRDDVLAIRAYLNTLDPVRHDVVSNQLPFPFDIRASLIGWNALFFKPGDFLPRPEKSSEWNRGAYIVEGLGHCGACHTRKNLLGGDDADRRLRGNPIQGWTAPGINADPHLGIGGWSVEEIAQYLKTGHNRYAGASGPMTEVVEYSTSRLTDADLRAIAVYLKDFPPADETRPPALAGGPAMAAGSAIYADACSACHAGNGHGVAGLFPDLVNSPQVQAMDPATLIRVVLQGARTVATDPAPTAAVMPGFGWKLDDEQIAAVITFIRNSWGNAAAAVSAGDIRAVRHSFSRNP